MSIISTLFSIFSSTLWSIIDWIFWFLSFIATLIFGYLAILLFLSVLNIIIEIFADWFGVDLKENIIIIGSAKNTNSFKNKLENNNNLLKELYVAVQELKKEIEELKKQLK